jgi:palmitoyltransferase ZDHHC9/14/18
MIYQSPKTKHCDECDACVQDRLFHSFFAANCIGQRNFKYFFGFVLVTFVNGWHTFVEESYGLYFRLFKFNSSHLSFKQILKTHPGFLIVLPYIFT